jgi:hypothetical protein
MPSSGEIISGMISKSLWWFLRTINSRSLCPPVRIKDMDDAYPLNCVLDIEYIRESEQRLGELYFTRL